MKVAFLMDPIATINRKKDTTLAFILASQKKGYQNYYLSQSSIEISSGFVGAWLAPITVTEPLSTSEISIGTLQWTFLSDVDVVMMRQDPPFNERYLTTTYLLDKAQAQGVRVVNDPTSVRSCNEKLFALDFPEYTPPHLVSCNMAAIKYFLEEHQDVIVKPLDGMGGASIFRIKVGDPNTTVILETLTQNQARVVMAQRYIPEISQGDKRILIVNGKVVDYALARVPSQGELRGNLAAGGTGIAQQLSQNDRRIAEGIVPTLNKLKLSFVGIDVIGDYLTEINVTSPTCVRELDEQCELDIANHFFSTL